MKLLQNIRDVFKTIKHSKPTQIYCPRCASPKLSLSSSMDYWLTPQKYICKNCGYIGTIFMELEKEKEAENPTNLASRAAQDSTVSSASCNGS